jgi:alkylhydroperoxidase/carboxymuconolactone decarboxylase family protein YurZ
MSDEQIPKHYLSLKRRFPDLIRAIEELGETAKDAGPLPADTAHLIQMAAAAAVRSEGAVHSHARRAVEAGATSDEVYHAVILLANTLGFPALAATMSWVDDLELDR